MREFLNCISALSLCNSSSEPRVSGREKAVANLQGMFWLESTGTTASPHIAVPPPLLLCLAWLPLFFYKTAGRCVLTRRLSGNLKIKNEPTPTCKPSSVLPPLSFASVLFSHPITSRDVHFYQMDHQNPLFIPESGWILRFEGDVDSIAEFSGSGISWQLVTNPKWWKKPSGD